MCTKFQLDPIRTSEIVAVQTKIGIFRWPTLYITELRILCCVEKLDLFSIPYTLFSLLGVQSQIDISVSSLNTVGFSGVAKNRRLAAYRRRTSKHMRAVWPGC